MSDLKPIDEQSLLDNLEITPAGKDPSSRTRIVFKKSVLIGKVSSADVLNAILIAARMQAEKYIEKLSRGAPLEIAEVKALKELAEITKLETPQLSRPKEQQLSAVDVDTVKSTLYQALTDKLTSTTLRNENKE